jgi:hypothetical protein
MSVTFEAVVRTAMMDILFMSDKEQKPLNIEERISRSISSKYNRARTK